MKDIEYDIRIAKIRELAATNSISRWELLRYTDGGISVSLTSRFIPTTEKKQVSLIVGTCYHYTRNLLRHRILCYNIEVIFDVDPFPYSTTGAEDASIYIHA